MRTRLDRQDNQAIAQMPTSFVPRSGLVLWTACFVVVLLSQPSSVSADLLHQLEVLGSVSNGNNYVRLFVVTDTDVIYAVHVVPASTQIFVNQDSMEISGNVQVLQPVSKSSETWLLSVVYRAVIQKYCVAYTNISSGFKAKSISFCDEGFFTLLDSVTAAPVRQLRAVAVVGLNSSSTPKSLVFSYLLENGTFSADPTDPDAAKTITKNIASTAGFVVDSLNYKHSIVIAQTGPHALSAGWFNSKRADVAELINFCSLNNNQCSISEDIVAYSVGLTTLHYAVVVLQTSSQLHLVSLYLNDSSKQIELQTPIKHINYTFDTSIRNSATPGYFLLVNNNPTAPVKSYIVYSNADGFPIYRLISSDGIVGPEVAIDATLKGSVLSASSNRHGELLVAYGFVHDIEDFYINVFATCGADVKIYAPVYSPLAAEFLLTALSEDPCSNAEPLRGARVLMMGPGSSSVQVVGPDLAEPIEEGNSTGCTANFSTESHFRCVKVDSQDNPVREKFLFAANETDALLVLPRLHNKTRWFVSSRPNSSVTTQGLVKQVEFNEDTDELLVIVEFPDYANPNLCLFTGPAAEVLLAIDGFGTSNTSIKPLCVSNKSLIAAKAVPDSPVVAFAYVVPQKDPSQLRYGYVNVTAQTSHQASIELPFPVGILDLVVNHHYTVLHVFDAITRRKPFYVTYKAPELKANSTYSDSLAVIAHHCETFSATLGPNNILVTATQTRWTENLISGPKLLANVSLQVHHILPNGTVRHNAGRNLTALRLQSLANDKRVFYKLVQNPATKTEDRVYFVYSNDVGAGPQTKYIVIERGFIGEEVLAGPGILYGASSNKFGELTILFGDPAENTYQIYTSVTAGILADSIVQLPFPQDRFGRIAMGSHSGPNGNGVTVVLSGPAGENLLFTSTNKIAKTGVQQNPNLPTASASMVPGPSWWAFATLLLTFCLF